MKLYYKFLIALAVFLSVLLVSFWLGKYLLQQESIPNIILHFGWLAIFIISIISGFNLVVPVPAIAFLPIYLAAGYEVWLVLLVITLGMTLGDGLGFWLGFSGRKVLVKYNWPWFDRLDKLRVKHYRLPLLLLVIYASFVPLPNELLVIPLGIWGYKPRDILIILFIGNFIFNTLVALGIVHLIKFIT